MVEWHAMMTPGDSCGRITAYGVDVVEGDTQPPIAINLHDSRISVSRSNLVQIGSGHSLHNTGSIEIGRVITAIDSCQASPDEKQEAKSLFEKLAANLAFSSIIGAIMGMGSGATGAQ
ncbi:hypothetical protein [Methylobacterium nonmethylotrophicum]|uniref:Uncharacterized protein n=1 Tax=Methylobacterium nonmethylotrophicum TaxID=1141884 RepID=A0A4Z0NV10_9HYPH|nr:hypothetical protein [Methylobacterium nonmethylotrophicum]TGE01424.1 hypothetical protein EU555_04785 [Methylobacterium nonmethylotrophicum]